MAQQRPLNRQNSTPPPARRGGAQQTARGGPLPGLLAAAVAGVLLFTCAANGYLGRIAVSAALFSAKLSVPRGGAEMLIETAQRAGRLFTPANSDASDVLSSSTPASSAQSSSQASGSAAAGASSAAPK